MSPSLKLRPIARAVVYDEETQKLLLARNRGADYWYPPGGGWEFDRETLPEAARREVREETGLDVEIVRLLYAQQFRASETTMYLELFWLARPQGNARRVEGHTDEDGAVEETRWFAREELTSLTVYPDRLKTTFWERINGVDAGEDPFIAPG